MRRKRIILIIVIAVIIAITITVAILLLRSSNDDLKVKRLMSGSSQTVSDYKNSRLKLHDNGTFEIEIILYENTKIFAAIGTYTKSGNKYTFYYLDAHTNRDGVISSDHEYIFKKHTYNVDRSTGWIVFYNHMGNPFHFG